MKADSSNEKFSDNWKNKLEDIAGLQHAALQNKDTAWEKLQARLENKPQKKRVAWYWLAAASILIAASITLFTTPSINDTAQQQSSSTNNNKKSFTKKDEPVKNIASEPSTNNQLKKQLQQSSITKAGAKKIIMMADSANHTGFTNNTQQPENKNIVFSIVNDTNSIAVISVISNQKKLKVVHVNELGEPVEFPADVAHSSDLHLFQLKLAQQEIYNASSMASNNSSVLSLKPKNIPK